MNRVLLLAPVDGDAAVLSHVLGQGGYQTLKCSNVDQMGAEISGAGAAAIIVAQEALGPRSEDEQRRLGRVLGAQPKWSDLPVILLAGSSSGEDGAWAIARALDPVGNITILERPLRRTTLLNAVDVALRARARQYELRATLAELAEHRERLQELVEERTRELSASMVSLHASERLASLGTLAAGLGHDIANLTLPIRMRLEAIRAGCSTEEAVSDIDAIRVAMEHLVRLSAGMRMLGIDPERAAATGIADDLTNWAAETSPMLRAALPRAIRFESAIATGLGVRVARHRLAQAIFNLVQNAGEAMAGRAGGVVRLEAEQGGDVAGEATVRILVRDDGPGMSAEVMSHCFEPYFSTKGRAIVTGMGLSMVKGIVEDAGGTVEVASTAGKGTVFTLTLPAAGAAMAASAEVCAVSLTQGRKANLAAMFAEQLGLTVIRVAEGSVPNVRLWITEATEVPRLVEFLRGDAKRRVVVLGGDKEEIADATAALAGGGQRAIVLPETPTAGVLRDGLRTARVSVERGKKP